MVKTLKQKEIEKRKTLKLLKKENKDEILKLNQEIIIIKYLKKNIELERKKKIKEETSDIDNKLKEISSKRSLLIKEQREKYVKEKDEIINKINNEYDSLIEIENKKIEELDKLIKDSSTPTLEKSIINYLDENNQELDEELELEEQELEDFEIKILKQDNQEIKNIIHLADIHIYLSKRHYEYQQVFNDLYEFFGDAYSLNIHADTQEIFIAKK
jgi:hypothetical protein